MCTDKSPKAFVLSAGIQKLPITWLSVDNFDDRVLCYKPTSINHNIHGCFLWSYRATGWFWWISGLRAVAMWSSSSFTISKLVKRNLLPRSPITEWRPIKLEHVENSSCKRQNWLYGTNHMYETRCPKYGRQSVGNSPPPPARTTITWWNHGMETKSKL